MASISPFDFLSAFTSRESEPQDNSFMVKRPTQIAGLLVAPNVTEEGYYTGHNRIVDYDQIPNAPGFDPNETKEYRKPAWSSFGVMEPDSRGIARELFGSSVGRGYSQFLPGGAPAIKGYDYDASIKLAEDMAAQGYANYMIDPATGEYYPRGTMPLQFDKPFEDSAYGRTRLSREELLPKMYLSR